MFNLVFNNEKNHLVNSSSSGIFVLIYFICVFVVVIPLITLEFAVGQLSCGHVGYWTFCPLFRGMEYLGFCVNFYALVVVSIQVSWSWLYFMYCFEPDLPWMKCRAPWATPSECYQTFRYAICNTCHDANKKNWR